MASIISAWKLKKRNNEVNFKSIAKYVTFFFLNIPIDVLKISN